MNTANTANTAIFAFIQCSYNSSAIAKKLINIVKYDSLCKSLHNSLATTFRMYIVITQLSCNRKEVDYTLAYTAKSK